MALNPEFLKRNFETLLRENGPIIYTLAVRLMGSTAEGQELAEDTFVKAYDQLDELHEQGTTGTWLYGICISIWKHRVGYGAPRSGWSFLAPKNHDKDDAAKSATPDEAQPIWEAIKDLDRDSAVPRALSQLKNEDRALIVMRDMADEPYTEISKLLGISIGTVKSRLAESRDKLREILEHKEP